jgi:hypothetical protein
MASQGGKHSIDVSSCFRRKAMTPMRLEIFLDFEIEYKEMMMFHLDFQMYVVLDGLLLGAKGSSHILQYRIKSSSF